MNLPPLPSTGQKENINISSGVGSSSEASRREKKAAAGERDRAERAEAAALSQEASAAGYSAGYSRLVHAGTATTLADRDAFPEVTGLKAVAGPVAAMLRTNATAQAAAG